MTPFTHTQGDEPGDELVSNNPDLGQPVISLARLRECLDENGTLTLGESRALLDIAEAAQAFDWLLNWCETHAPAALHEMPSDLWRTIKPAGRALASLDAADSGEAT